MEKLDFELDNIFRYFLAGVTAPITLLITYPQIPDFMPKIESINFTITIGVIILFISIMMYSIHRSFLYPICQRILIKMIYNTKGCIILNKRMNDQKDEIDYKRFKSHSSENKNNIKYDKLIREWFSRIHFMYLTSWFIFFTLIVGALTPSCSNGGAIVFFIIMGIIIFSSAIREDYKAMVMQKKHETEP